VGVMREHDIERIKELWERGATLEEIAREFGISIGSVDYWIRRLNLPRRGRGRRSSVRRRVDPQRLKELVEQGLDDFEIACAMGVSDGTVRTYRYRLKLKSKRPTNPRVVGVLHVLDQFEPDVMVTERWIAEKLGVPVCVVRRKLKLLEVVGAVLKVSEGLWKLNPESLWAAIANGPYRDGLKVVLGETEEVK